MFNNALIEGLGTCISHQTDMNSEQNDTNLCLNIVRIVEERRECCYVGLCYIGLCEGVFHIKLT